jgi:hypothetical protein
MLGLCEEVQNGVYTCCQIATWADEQSLAWFEAADEDSKHSNEPNSANFQPQTVLLPVRFRRPTTWFRKPDDLW